MGPTSKNVTESTDCSLKVLRIQCIVSIVSSAWCESAIV